MKHSIILAITLFICYTFSIAQNETLVPYRKGKLWGLADTNVNIIVEPAYDSIRYSSNYPNGFYVVERNGFQGVITSKNEIIEPKLQHVSFRYDFIFDYFKDEFNKFRRIGQIYTLDGKLAMPDTIRNVSKIYEVKEANLYRIVRTDNRSSVMVYDEINQEIVDWLVEDCKQVYPITLGGKLLLKCGQGNNQYDTYTVNIESRTQVTATKLLDEELQQVNDELEEYYDEEMDIMVEEDRYTDSRIQSNENGIIECHLQKKSFYITKQKATKSRANPYKRSKIVFTMSLDTIMSGPISKKKRRLREYEHRYGTLDKQFYNPKTGTYWDRSNPARPINYIEFEEKRKLGIINEFGTIQPQFDTIIGYAALQRWTPYYIVGVRSNKKSPLQFGVITADSTWLVPVSADDVRPYIFSSSRYGNEKLFYTYGFIVSKSNKESLVLRNGETILEGFDSIIPYPNHMESVITVRNGKYGYYNHLTNIPAIHDYRPLGYGYFNQIKVVSLYDENFRFLGYAKKSGEVFFED